MKIKMDLNTNLTLADALEKFERHCKIKNLAAATIQSYKDKLKSFSTFLGLDYSINEISKEDIENYILSLQERNLKPVTINTNLRAVRALLNFLAEEKYIQQPIKIQLLREEKEIKETYTEIELKKLLKKPNLRKVEFNEYKIWVLENYLLGTGNRIATALEIKIGDIDFSGAVITLKKSKNRKQQIIPLSSTLIKILQEYLSIRKGTTEDYLFCNSWGGKANKRTIQQMVADYNNARGVAKTSCHLFRHTFAKMYILNGGDAFRLQKLLNHSTLAVTKEYVNMFGTDLSLNYDALNPLENFSMAARSKRISITQ